MDKLDSAIALAKHVERTIAGDSCIGLYLEAMRLAKKLDRHGRQIYLHDKLAENYIYFNQYEKCKSHIDSALIIAEVHDSHYEAIGMCYSTLGRYYIRIREYDKGFEFVQKTLNYRLKNLGTDHEDISNSYFDLANYYLRTRREYDKAIEFGNKALEMRIQEYGKESAEAGECYNNMASAYSSLGDLKKAVNYQIKAVQIFEKTLPRNSYGILLGYFNMGSYQYSFGNYDEAINWYNKVIDADTNNENYLFKVYNNNNLADCYLNSDLSKAKSLYQKTLKTLSEKFGDRHIRTSSTHMRLSNYYKLKNNFDSAFYHMNIGDSLIRDGFGINSIEYAKTSIQLAGIYFHFEKYKQVVSKASDAIDAISSNRLTNEVNTTQKTSKWPDRIDLVNALYIKSRGLEKLNTRESLFEAFDLIKDAIKIIERIKRKYTTDNSRSFLSTKTESIYAQAIQLAIKIAELTNQKDYYDVAFTIAEKSRAFNLLNEVQNSKAKKFAGIPLKIIEKEDSLKREMTFYQDLIQQYSKLKTPVEDKLANVKSRLLALERVYDKFIANLEKHYPKYYQIKNQDINITPALIQPTLAANEALVEYFLSETQLTIFVVTMDTFKVFNETNKLDLIKEIQELHGAINKFEKETFQQKSNSLYKSLIESLDTFLPKHINKLKIVPHNEISYLSFDCLITNENKYLIEDYQTSYYYSAFFALQKNDSQHLNSNDIVIFAPIYDDESVNNLPVLTQSEIEANNIFEMFKKNNSNPQLAIRKKASKANFKEIAGNYGIIHLATHTILDKNTVEQSTINFWGNKESKLSLSETYNLNINSKLLTLSSCESGVGELINGEGMMSFTRGFSYSGAQNIICSLWKVNDYYTSKTMINMYKHINNDMGFGESLRLAKIQLIKEKPDLSPKDWAGFVLISNGSF